MLGRFAWLARQGWYCSVRTGTLLLAVATLALGGESAARAAPEDVGPPDLSTWRDGPVYVLELHGGSRFGLIPEVLQDYREATADLDLGDTLIVVIDEQTQIAPWDMDKAVALVAEWEERTNTVLFGLDPKDGGAVLAVAFKKRYLAPGAALRCAKSTRTDLEWEVSYSLGYGRREEQPDYSNIAREIAEMGDSPVVLLYAMVDPYTPLSYDIGDDNRYTWREDEGGAHQVTRSSGAWEIPGALAIDAGLVTGEVEDPRALAVQLTDDADIRLEPIADEVARRWRGRIESADQIVPETLDRIYAFDRETYHSDDPVSEETLAELDCDLAVLAYWAEQLGSVDRCYSISEGMVWYYTTLAKVVRKTGKHWQNLTEAELEEPGKSWSPTSYED